MWSVRCEYQMVSELSILLAIVLLYSATILCRTSLAQDNFAPGEALSGLEVVDVSPYASNSPYKYKKKTNNSSSGDRKFAILWRKKRNGTARYEKMDFVWPRKRSKRSGYGWTKICGFNGDNDHRRAGYDRSNYTGEDPSENEAPPFEGKGVERIYKGLDAKPGQFPWMAKIKVFIHPSWIVSHTCTGTVVSEWIILTAAHCIQDCKSKPGRWVDVRSITAVIGQRDLDWWDININFANVDFDRLIVPEPDAMFPCWQGGRDHVALISRKKMDLLSGRSPDVPRPICMAHPDDRIIPSERTRLVTAGWGKTDEDDNYSKWLKYGELREIKTAAQGCRFRLGFICATGGRVPCYEYRDNMNLGGDAGAPLMRKVRRTFELAEGWTDMDVYVHLGTFSRDERNKTKCQPNNVLYFSDTRLSGWPSFIEDFDREEASFRSARSLRQAKARWGRES